MLRCALHGAHTGARLSDVPALSEYVNCLHGLMIKLIVSLTHATGCYQDTACNGRVIISGVPSQTSPPTASPTPATVNIKVDVNSVTDNSGSSSNCAYSIASMDSARPAANTCNLRSAIKLCAATDSDECVIELPTGLTSAISMKVAGGAIVVSASKSARITILGRGNTVSMDSQIPPHFLQVAAVASLHVYDLTIIGFDKGIYVTGPNIPSTLSHHFENVVFEENAEGLSMEVLENIEVVNCQFIRTHKGLRTYKVNKMLVDGCVFTDNFCSYEGCGLYTYGSKEILIQNSYFVGNRALDMSDGGTLRLDLYTYCLA